MRSFIACSAARGARALRAEPRVAKVTQRRDRHPLGRCARALAGQPEIIFGDEPTGNLDSRSSGEVLSILRAAVDEFHQTVVIVTHDPRAASFADRVVFLADGQIVDELREPTAESVLDRMKNLETV